ncbi:ABC transporter substrate-binding protein [Rubrivivax albus]|uniref:Sugar ABC transporter substrate-binding protein n=1 Tax=Rubrivivax albus TaxID=2499835 RepID=A0A3S2UMW7_9BURK|nr:sugar ABC transporter substrate-binding protein [Rubrivivax albus]RVT49422.1 sugar ABC transporter substrate-binding protein [Rubrivivax albus]
MSVVRRIVTLLVSAFAIVAASPAMAVEPVTVRYMMWDASQLPAYRACAADFERQNPDVRIRIGQAGWGDYWTAMTLGFIAGSAPDVFVNHLSKYPEFAANGLLEDLSPLIARDALDLGAFPPPLVQAWRRGAQQYGLPKDWDTVAMIVNLDHARAAGVSLDELRQMDWNPRDGGSFGRIVRRLTRDTAGRSAAEAGFDPRRVAMWGYQNPGAGGMTGQTEWSHFAASLGHRVQGAPWQLPLHYDDPRLAATLDWLATLAPRGLSAPDALVRSLGAGALFVAGKAAIVPDGSWMIGYYAGAARFETAWVPLPKGPDGRRASMLNGLGDSMWVGSRVKPQAWRWMRHLASAACQQRVAKDGVVFPARDGLAAQVVAQHRQRGVDAQAFLDMAAADTFLMPVAEHNARVDVIVKRQIESVLLGQQPAAPALKAAQQRVDAVLLPRR